jgi:hypothetical protein
MDDEKKMNAEKDDSQETAVSRRSFLTSLGKWSSIVVATAAVGFSEALGSDRAKEEFDRTGAGGPGRESLPGDREMESDDMNPQWCRVWGNGRRAWANGCRVWGNGGRWRRCRVWGNW